MIKEAVEERKVLEDRKRRLEDQQSLEGGMVEGLEVEDGERERDTPGSGGMLGESVGSRDRIMWI